MEPFNTIATRLIDVYNDVEHNDFIISKRYSVAMLMDYYKCYTNNELSMNEIDNIVALFKNSVKNPEIRNLIKESGVIDHLLLVVLQVMKNVCDGTPNILNFVHNETDRLQVSRNSEYIVSEIVHEEWKRMLEENEVSFDEILCVNPVYEYDKYSDAMTAFIEDIGRIIHRILPDTKIIMTNIEYAVKWIDSQYDVDTDLYQRCCDILCQMKNDGFFERRVCANNKNVFGCIIFLLEGLYHVSKERRIDLTCVIPRDILYGIKWFDAYVKDYVYDVCSDI